MHKTGDYILDTKLSTQIFEAILNVRKHQADGTESGLPSGAAVEKKERIGSECDESESTESDSQVTKKFVTVSRSVDIVQPLDHKAANPVANKARLPVYCFIGFR